jgi:hypothetical protein
MGSARLRVAVLKRSLCPGALRFCSARLRVAVLKRSLCPGGLRVCIRTLTRGGSVILGSGRLQVIRDGGSVGSINREIEINRGLARIVQDGAVRQLVGFEHCLMLLRTIFDLEHGPFREPHSRSFTIPAEQNCIPLHLYPHSETRILPKEAAMQQGERQGASNQ